MLRKWLRLLYTAALIVGVLLSFFAAVEVLRAFQTLHGLHPAAGYAFLGLIALLVAWLLWRVIWAIAAHRPALTPPAIRDRENASMQELQRYNRYLARYVRRLTGNEAIPEEVRNKAAADLAALHGKLTGGSGRDALLETARKAETEIVEPLLKPLDAQADKHVRACVRDVTIGVALSPYRSADLLIVLYKNLVTLRRIIIVYNSRPTLREQFRVFRDILSVVATVNVLNLIGKLLGGLGGLPLVDPVVQGAGAGLMTSAAGHTAIHRCRAFRGWNAEEAKASLARNLSGFLADVTGIIVKDVVPALGKRAVHVAKRTVSGVTDAVKDAGKWLVGRKGEAGEGEPGEAPAM